MEGAKASAQQSADDLANARLVLTTDLATDYFSLRELDAEIDVLNQSLILQQKALDYVNAEHDLGSVSGLDVLQQKSILDSTRVQAQLLLNQRAEFEHAIAALVGVPAPQFAIEPKCSTTKVPAIPLGLPSDVLQRRPDMASAERAMAAANAQIGVAKAAFFPSLTLTPSIGWESTQFARPVERAEPDVDARRGGRPGGVRRRTPLGQRQVRERRLPGRRGELPADRAHRVPAGAGRHHRTVGAGWRVEAVARRR